jgi:hypothetical protein
MRFLPVFSHGVNVGKESRVLAPDQSFFELDLQSELPMMGKIG